MMEDQAESPTVYVEGTTAKQPTKRNKWIGGMEEVLEVDSRDADGVEVSFSVSRVSKGSKDTSENMTSIDEDDCTREDTAGGSMDDEPTADLGSRVSRGGFPSVKSSNSSGSGGCSEGGSWMGAVSRASSRLLSRSRGSASVETTASEATNEATEPDEKENMKPDSKAPKTLVTRSFESGRSGFSIPSAPSASSLMLALTDFDDRSITEGASRILKDWLRKVKAERDRLRNEKARLDQELTKERRGRAAEVATLQVEITMLQSDVTRLQGELLSAELFESNYKEELQSMANIDAKSRNDIENLTAENAEASAEIERTKKVISVLIEELQEAKNKLAEEEAQAAAEENKNDKTEGEQLQGDGPDVEYLQARLDSMKEREEAKGGEINQLQSQLEEWKSKVSTLEEALMEERSKNLLRDAEAEKEEQKPAQNNQEEQLKIFCESLGKAVAQLEEKFEHDLGQIAAKRESKTKVLTKKLDKRLQVLENTVNECISPRSSKQDESNDEPLDKSEDPASTSVQQNKAKEDCSTKGTTRTTNSRSKELSKKSKKKLEGICKSFKVTLQSISGRNSQHR
ncbi:hypothetical protein ACHAWF_006552 [Thalassiosira exigua]